MPQLDWGQNVPDLPRPGAESTAAIAGRSCGRPDNLLRRVIANETVAPGPGVAAVRAERVLAVVSRVRGDPSAVHVLVRAARELSQRVESGGELSNGRFWRMVVLDRGRGMMIV